MKKLRKAIILILAIAAVLSVFSLTAFAAEGEDEVSSSVNVFEAAYGVICENADGIFSALAFISTLFLAFIYKRGLTPYISRGLTTLGDGVGKIKELCEKNGESFGISCEKITEKLASLENTLDLFSGELVTLEERLGSEAKLISDSALMRKILLSQIDMLYELFISSAIPEYQKEAIGERVKKMKEALEENENG